jgi:hypothetical protein
MIGSLLFTVAVAVVMLSYSRSAAAEDIIRGDRVPLQARQGPKITTDEQVKLAVVVNPDAVSNKDKSFVFGDGCVIRLDYGSIEAIGLEGNRLLVRYSIKGDQRSISCPDGTLYFTTKDEFLGLVRENRRALAAKDAEGGLVSKLTNSLGNRLQTSVVGLSHRLSEDSSVSAASVRSTAFPN